MVYLELVKVHRPLIIIFLNFIFLGTEQRKCLVMGFSDMVRWT